MFGPDLNLSPPPHAAYLAPMEARIYGETAMVSPVGASDTRSPCFFDTKEGMALHVVSLEVFEVCAWDD